MVLAPCQWFEVSSISHFTVHRNHNPGHGGKDIFLVEGVVLCGDEWLLHDWNFCWGTCMGHFVVIVAIVVFWWGERFGLWWVLTEWILVLVMRKFGAVLLLERQNTSHSLTGREKKDGCHKQALSNVGSL